MISFFAQSERTPTVGDLGNSGDKAEMRNREIIASLIPYS